MRSFNGLHPLSHMVAWIHASRSRHTAAQTVLGFHSPVGSLLRAAGNRTALVGVFGVERVTKRLAWQQQ
jgi:hypothetical protein